MKKKSYTLKELANLTHCQLIGNSDYEINDVSDLENATAEHASFLSNPRYLQAMKNSKAGVIFVDRNAQILDGINYLISDNPSKSFQKLIDHLYPQRAHPSGFKGIHPTAVIHPTAKIGIEVTIGPHAVIDEEVEIGNRTFIGAGAYIGPKVHLGEDCLIHPHVTIRENCLIGNRVIIQPGAVIGSCGFGYITEKGCHNKLNQVGSVEIEDDVEIGANTTIDRARFQSTKVGKGTKIDNLVQIGHAVHIGQHNIIVAQTGIAGSASTGKYVVLAGQVAIAGHLHLDDGVTIAGKSGVTKSLTAGKYGGIPAIKLEEYNRNQVFLRNIEKYVRRIEKLENSDSGLD
jgi:UDP-3-O-[3-hydroxymyristoyl] glucosamine N-acyltransferase